MADLITGAINRVPSHHRQSAREVVFLSAAGYQPVEIGQRLGVSWHVVEDLRTMTQNAVVEVMRQDGFTTGEIVRGLGVPSGSIIE